MKVIDQAINLITRERDKLNEIIRTLEGYAGENNLPTATSVARPDVQTESPQKPSHE